MAARSLLARHPHDPLVWAEAVLTEWLMSLRERPICDTMTQTAADTARLVSEVGHPSVGVLYDQANLTFTHDETWQEAFAVQGELVRHVHVKDLVFKDPDARRTGLDLRP
ncbi:TIM barrel protein [Pseudonocardia sichuanensis]